MTLRFAWDPAKAAHNRAKHGVGFDLAARVFLDPFALTEQDRVEGGERRWRTVGLVEGVVVLVVAHTVEDGSGPEGELIRIISARRADRTERRRYDEQRLRASGG
ncbi:MAG: BrnT family toxin [Acetobacteraceae bacterium]|nr:BrnT family toxin [Acetobacteraceae bacterium]